MPTQQDLSEQITEKSRRLHQLKLQYARQGLRVDPAITLEIEDIEQELADLRHQLEIVPEASAAKLNTPATPAGQEISDQPPHISGSGNVVITGGTFTTGDRGVVASVASGDITTGDTATGLTDGVLNIIFETIARQIEDNPSLNPDDKADVTAEVDELKASLDALADAPAAQENFWQRRLRNIERMAPDIIDTIATTAVNPVGGLKGIWDKIVAKARQIQAER